MKIKRKIYDITKELLSSEVYPGDTIPSLRKVSNIKNGEVCNLSDLTMCVHNGTHIDAPYHFIEEGNDISEIPLERTIGHCVVFSCDTVFDKMNGEKRLQDAIEKYGNIERLLLKGNNAIISLSGAELLTEYSICLIGTERNTVGIPTEEDDIEQVHYHLLKNNVVILENLDLSQVKDGVYMLYALPLKIRGADGAPCRAILIDEEK